MKIRVVGNHGGLRLALENRLRMEGEELEGYIVEIGRNDHIDFRVSTFEGVALSDLTVEHIFGDVPCQSTETYNVVKVFDGQEFKGQTILALNFIGSCGENLGFPCSVGSVVKFIKKPLWYNEDALCSLLKEMSFRGFVTLEVNETKVVKIILGLPSFIGFALLERFPASLMKFDCQPDVTAFREAWGIASVVSSWPFPYNDGKTQSGVVVRVESSKILKHFFPFAKEVKNGSFRSFDCVLGVATAWEHDPRRLVSRLMTTCEAIQAPMKQFRTDLFETIEKKMEKVKGFLV